MRTNKIKKALCLVMILSLAAGWLHINVCVAEEANQSISEGTAEAGDNPSLEVLPEQNNEITQDEPKSETSQSQTSKSDIFENYILPVVLIPLIPVLIGMQIVCLFVTNDFGRCVGH